MTRVHKAPPRIYPLMRASVTMPQMGDGTGGTIAKVPGTGLPDPDEYKPTNVTRAVAGWLQVKIGGRDVTYWRGFPCEVLEYEHSEPWGSVSATISFPQITPFDLISVGNLEWLSNGSVVEINLIGRDKNLKRRLFKGIIVSIDREFPYNNTGDTPHIEVECQGLMFQAQYQEAQPEVVWDTMDVADAIKELLDKGVKGRRFGALRVPEGGTGILLRSQSAWEPITERVEDILATAVDEDGRQWTVKHDLKTPPRLEMKDYETVHWTTWAGAPGVGFRVKRDITDQITTVYGRGIDKSGEGWANLKTPDYSPLLKPRDDAGDPDVDGLEPYPWTTAATKITAGMSDGATDTGNGVTVLQKRLKKLGANISVTGSYNTETQAAVRAFQKRKGLVPDKIVGGQTWTSLFYGGAEGRALENAYYAPLHSRSVVEKWLYYPDGSRKELNPDYNPRNLRRERFHAYPDGMTKEQAIEAARNEVARDHKPGHVGEITLEVDPEEGSKFEILAGQNILMKNWRGGLISDIPEMLFHIVSVSAEPMEDRVTLTVDTEARDIITLDAIFERNNAAKNPARRAKSQRRSEMEPSRTVLDGELIGRIHAVTEADRWSVCKVPIGTEGDVVKVDITAEDETADFVVAFFGGPVTPRDLAPAANPFVKLSGDVDPFPGDDPDYWEALQIIDVLGRPGERAGYWPGKESKEDPVTGRHKDHSINLHYTSTRPPFLWVAVYTGNQSSRVSGRVYQAPQGW